MERKPIRQGDVLLIPVESAPAWGTDSWSKPTVNPEDRTRVDGKVLAFGEVTGHAHVLQTDAPLIVGRVFDSLLRTWRDREYLDLQESAKLVHEEHATLEVPAGKWEVIHQREYAGPQRQWSRVRD